MFGNVFNAEKGTDLIKVLQEVVNVVVYYIVMSATLTIRHVNNVDINMVLIV